MGQGYDLNPWWSAVAIAGMGLLLLARPASARLEQVVSLPWQIYRIATDARLRRNHALEHATLNVYTQRYGVPQLNGVAVQAGFVARGLVNPPLILAAANEGLARLQAGETSLAYHPRCGTSIGTADVLAWAVLAGLLAMLGQLTLPALAAGMVLAAVGGPLLGRWVQRHLTTSTDLSGLTIRGMTVQARPAPVGVGGAAGNGEFWGEVVVLVQQPAPRDLAAIRR